MSNNNRPLLTPQEAISRMAAFEVKDNRPTSGRVFPLEFQAVSTDLIECYEELYSAVSDFVCTKGNPVYEINQLLRYALAEKKYVSQDAIEVLLNTTAFLYSLKTADSRVLFIKEEANKAWQHVQEQAEKEVNHGK